MKMILASLALVFLAGCTQGSPSGVARSSVSSASQISSAAMDTGSHQLAATSEVRATDQEWNEYINHDLGIAIPFPKQVLEATMYDPNSETHPTVPVRVIEDGEVITFSRGYNLDISHLDEAGNATKAAEDLTVRHPYYSQAYLQDPIYPHYPYQIYAAKADSIADVGAFIQRAYGEGCTVDEKMGSRYDNRPGVLTFSIEPQVESCPGYYPIGDVVTWYQNEHVVVGIQPGWTGNFLRPYPTKLDEKNYYELKVRMLAQ